MIDMSGCAFRGGANAFHCLSRNGSGTMSYPLISTRYRHSLMLYYILPVQYHVCMRKCDRYNTGFEE